MMERDRKRSDDGKGSGKVIDDGKGSDRKDAREMGKEAKMGKRLTMESVDNEKVIHNGKFIDMASDSFELSPHSLHMYLFYQPFLTAYFLSLAAIAPLPALHPSPITLL